ncbi:hypothetical protein ACU6VJ_05125 [Sphaerotilus sulfidivorans]|nr:hypothetical protein CQA4T8M7_13510 [Sphaerotilus natans]
MAAFNTFNTFNRLRSLTAARDALNADWGRFHAVYTPTGAESLEDLDELGRAAIRAALGQDDMPDAEAERIADLLADCAEAEEAADHMPAAELAALLVELTAAGDAAGLRLALNLSPHDSDAYVDHLRELADSVGPETQVDAATVRAEQVRALMASPKPGRSVTEELAGAIVDAIDAWARLKVETPEQRAIREAFAEARRLMDLHGDRDPRTMDAVIKALEWQDPGCCARMLAADGITLPTPTHCTAEGEPLYSLEALADALGADPEDLEAIAEEMEEVGLTVRHQPAGSLH